MEAGDDGQEGCRKSQKRGHTKKGQRRGRLEDGRNARLEETIDREENGRSQKVKYVLCALLTYFFLGVSWVVEFLNYIYMHEDCQVCSIFAIAYSLFI